MLVTVNALNSFAKTHGLENYTTEGRPMNFMATGLSIEVPQESGLELVTLSKCRERQKVGWYLADLIFRMALMLNLV